MSPKQEEKLDQLCSDVKSLKTDMNTVKAEMENMKAFKWTVTGIATGISVAAGAVWTFLTKGD